MKKILLILISATTLCSCDSFINLDPISEQNSNGFYKGSYEVDQALAAAYSSLQSYNQYGGNGFQSFMEITSDNTWNPNTTQEGGAYAAFDNFMVDATNIQVKNTWISCYSGIQRCNIVISRLNAMTDIDSNIKGQKLGEAYFLRALTYFNIVRIWGDAPLILEEITNVNDSFGHTRTSSENIYKQIIEDLKNASKVLPKSYDNANIGRATLGAAQTLLAKVYLTLNEYEPCLSLLNSVISSKTYSLVPSFADIFSTSNKNNEESIFEIQFDKVIEGEGYPGTDPLIMSSDVNNIPSENLIELFENNPDDRKDASIIDLGTLGKRLYKWHDTKGSNGCLGFDIIVLRYADVLLMAAEAMNEKSYGKEEALEYLNMIRRRSHASEYTYTILSDQESFREAIAKERRLELAFENHRWFDLVRTGKAIEVMNSSKGVAIFPIKVQSTQLLFPIPQSEIDASAGKLTQNDGY